MEIIKKCFKCRETKPLSAFYRHKQMADGHLNKCKSCTKTDSTNHRNNNLEKIREYDRKRGARQTPEYFIKKRLKHPQQYKAVTIVNNAIRDGKLFKEPCEECKRTTRVHAHHDDYAKPLNVRWLCAHHHSIWHRDNGEGLNLSMDKPRSGAFLFTLP